MVPHRFKELDIFTAHNQTKVMVSKEPVSSYSSFTILKPTGVNFSLLFFAGPELAMTIEFFFENSLNREAGIPKADAAKIAKAIMTTLPKICLLYTSRCV